MTFKRGFGRCPEDRERLAQTPWGRDLLGLWRPAGQPTCSDNGLRLAIRQRTLNFYRRGQSVAKVSFDRDHRPQMEIDVAYVTGRFGQGARYYKLTSDNPGSRYHGAANLAEWVARADGKKGPEKKFVDDLVTHNPQVIDLEMGLSDYKEEPDGKSKAPRMDLVALEDTAGGLQIAFWEAKMMGNEGLRCKPEMGKPHVVEQLAKYTTWLGQGSNRADVIEAYQANCQLLIELHALARSINPEIGPLSPMIVRAAEGPPLKVDDRPRVIVSDPEANKSWTANGHDLVLSEMGIQVQLVSGKSPANNSYVLQGRA